MCLGQLIFLHSEWQKCLSLVRSILRGHYEEVLTSDVGQIVLGTNSDDVQDGDISAHILKGAGTLHNQLGGDTNARSVTYQLRNKIMSN